jgi:hypothetical protein
MTRTPPSRRLTWHERILIRLCVGGSLLSCGCLTGRYLSYSEELLEVIDERGRLCGNVRHQLDAILGEGSQLA